MINNKLKIFLLSMKIKQLFFLFSILVVVQNVIADKIIKTDIKIPTDREAKKIPAHWQGLLIFIMSYRVD